MPAYHYIQLPHHIVGFDNPIDGLGTFKQQGYVPYHHTIIVQRP